jgi:hypothetical protein
MNVSNQPRPKRGISGGQALFVLIILLFAGYIIYTTLNPRVQRYAQIESGSIGQSYYGDCLIVRSEIPYDAEGVTHIDYVANEGTMIYRGTTICYIYSSGYNQREVATLRNYRDQIKLNHMKLLSSEIAYDQKMLRLEADVLERAAEIRKLVHGARGNLVNQEKIFASAISARQNYLRQKYADNQILTRLYDDESAQLKRIESWTKQYTASQDGIVSFYSDGYEYGLNSTDYTKFTPQEVRAMIGGSVPEKTSVQKGRTTIYRLVRQNAWNVLLLVGDTAWNPVEGQTYRLYLSGFDDTVVDALVVSSTRSGGELLIRLDVRADVTPVLYMRTCQAELGEYVNSMIVPQNAIYKLDGADGVVLVNGDSRLFVPVRIIRQESGRAYIEALQPGFLSVGQTIMLF